MSNHTITDVQNRFVQAEPVIAAHAGAAILGYVGTLLVTHGVITHDQASALTQQVMPAVVAGLLVVLGVVVRRFVAPAALFAQRVEDEVQKRLEAFTGTVPTRSSQQTITTGTAVPVAITYTTGSTSSTSTGSAGADLLDALAAIDAAPVLDAEVPAAAEPALDGALPTDLTAGAHAADTLPPPA